jgi:hypothetical protein
MFLLLVWFISRLYIIEVNALTLMFADRAPFLCQEQLTPLPKLMIVFTCLVVDTIKFVWVTSIRLIHQHWHGQGLQYFIMSNCLFIVIYLTDSVTCWIGLTRQNLPSFAHFDFFPVFMMEKSSFWGSNRHFWDVLLVFLPFEFGCTHCTTLKIFRSFKVYACTFESQISTFWGTCGLPF